MPSGEDSLFALEGFDEEQVYVGESTDDGTNVGDIAFPQSDDEDSSTNGKCVLEVMEVHGHVSVTNSNCFLMQIVHLEMCLL